MTWVEGLSSASVAFVKADPSAGSIRMLKLVSFESVLPAFP